MQAGTPAFREAIMEVLSNPRYTKAAQAMSVKIRARKNTPVQEAAGKHSIHTSSPTVVLDTSKLDLTCSNLVTALRSSSSRMV